MAAALNDQLEPLRQIGEPVECHSTGANGVLIECREAGIKIAVQYHYPIDAPMLATSTIATIWVKGQRIEPRQIFYRGQNSDGLAQAVLERLKPIWRQVIHHHMY